MQVLFLKIIQKWYEPAHREKDYNTLQLKNLLHRDHVDEEVIVQCLDDYSDYFEVVRTHLRRPDWRKLTRDFPSCFDLSSTPEDEVRKAFHDEKSAVEQDQRKNWVVAKVLRLLRETANGKQYEAVISLPDGLAAPGQDGLPIDLWWPELQDGGVARGVLLAYYNRTSTVIFRTNQALSAEQMNGRFRFRTHPIDFLKKIQKQFEEIPNHPESAAARLFERRDLVRTGNGTVTIVDPEVNTPQRLVMERVFGQDLTFIWGPPGTGKTFTLAKIIARAAAQGRKVLASGISNIAVDHLTRAVVKEMERVRETRELLEARKVLRFGYPALPEINADDRLFPDKDHILTLRREVGRLQAALARTAENLPERRAELRDQLVVLRAQLKKANEARVREASITLTTSAMCFLSDAFQPEQFDMVIIDEVSMMPLVQTVAMALFTRDKLVITGDFKQLGPICVSTTEAARNWFATDIFSYLRKVPAFREQGLVMLNEQHRMDPEICDLINERFYDGRLRTRVDRAPLTLNGFEFLGSAAVSFIQLGLQDGSRVSMTETRSRRNHTSAELVVVLVQTLVRDVQGVTIGVVAPYNGQVQLIQHLLRSSMLTSEKMDRVKVGTIHSFQGSEYDIILWDVVDSTDRRIGQLYKGDTGERLVNVAISRARQKLIIIGDPKVFTFSDELGEVSKYLRSLFLELRSHNEVCIQASEVKAQLGLK
ncbi:MAG: AAA family ATPase [Flavobacteriales bacterium]|nr:AAA family ATPase [Flavobacteriales bacterium]